MLHKPIRTYLRLRRREWGLSQDELASLVGTNGSVISDYEREVHPVSVRLLIAAELIFGTPARELFPDLYWDVEDQVSRAAIALHLNLEGKTDPQSAKKRRLLASIADRVGPRGL